MSGRRYLCGAQKRKISEERKEKLDEELRKTPEIDKLVNVAGPSTTRGKSDIEVKAIENGTGNIM